tara:strand:- start:374 stop:586 length:213 start_codon:yes stop_codon:yes gene_type:complete
MNTKYSKSLIEQARFLAFSGEIPNKSIGKFLGLSKNELEYIIYKLKHEKRLSIVEHFDSIFTFGCHHDKS